MRDEIRDNYKLVSCPVLLSLVEFWRGSLFELACATEFRHSSGKSEWRGSPISRKNSRSRTRRHVLRRDHTRGSLVSILSSLYVFLTSFDFCELEIAPPSSRNRKRIDSGARMRSNIGNGRHDLFENLEYFANFLRPKNLWYRIVLDLITRPPVFSRIRYG